MSDLPHLKAEQVSLIVNTAIATSHLESIQTPFARIRPQMHLILCGRIGSFKSEILSKVCEELKVLLQFNVSKAVMLGSGDKNTGMTSPPLIWSCRNSVLPIDELYIAPKTPEFYVLNSLLSLLEKPVYEKRIGYRLNDSEEIEGSLYLKVKNSIISCRSRFVFMATSMMDLHKHQTLIELEALKSRCIIVPFYPTMAELINILNGEKHYVYKHLKPKKKNCKIDMKTHRKLMGLLIEANIDEGNIARTYGDLARTYAIHGYNKAAFDLILKLRKAVK